jgi:hypothetical protein
MADRTKKLFSKECKVVNDNHKNVITRLDRSAVKQHAVFSANSNDLLEILWSSHRMTGNATTRKAGKGSQRTIMKMYSIMAANENHQNVIVRSAKHNVTFFGRKSDNTAAVKQAA